MIAVAGFAGRVVAVFGLGKSGLSTVRALEAGGAKVIAWDDTEAKRVEAAEAGVTLEDLATRDWSDVAALVLSPGVPLTHPEPHWSAKRATAAGVEIIGDIELLGRTLKASDAGARVVAITGTNGKSTTTALIGHMVKRCGGDAQVGGNIGKPVFDLDPPKSTSVYVIEVSSYQLDLAPGLRPMSRFCSTSPPTISTVTARSRTMRRSRHIFSRTRRRRTRRLSASTTAIRPTSAPRSPPP